MVRAFTQEYTYKHPWERVTSAFWRKFGEPENRLIYHIVEVETLNRRLDPPSGKLYSTRAITIQCPGPWFLRKMVGQDICHCVESTVVDARSQSMQLTTRNISLRKMIEVEENIRYYPHPENPSGWTICRHHTRICIKPLSTLASIAEKLELLSLSFRMVLRVERSWRASVNILRPSLRGFPVHSFQSSNQSSLL